jgi:hypothetical protein
MNVKYVGLFGLVHALKLTNSIWWVGMALRCKYFQVCSSLGFEFMFYFYDGTDGFIKRGSSCTYKSVVHMR